MNDLNFYKGKKVFVTGHTGFKGSWMCKVLKMLGANVKGYALAPNTNPTLYQILNIDEIAESYIGDIRDLKNLQREMTLFSPEIVVHMAAQPIVKDSYTNPVYTYETNVMGTVNVLEAVRNCNSVRSFVNVTTDKVYENNEWYWGYRENDLLNGHDPYSNSKSCSELVTDSYKKSFFYDKQIAISTVRAGNVIGGGDFANFRIIPDCVKAATQNETIIVRNPYSIRPYQHVLEPVVGYLTLAMLQYENKEKYESCYNLGPNDSDCITTGELVTLFCKYWENMKWLNKAEKDAVHEASFLKLDCSKIKKQLDWKPKWNVEMAVRKTVEWSKAYYDNEDIINITEKQIEDYLKY